MEYRYEREKMSSIATVFDIGTRRGFLTLHHQAISTDKWGLYISCNNENYVCDSSNEPRPPMFPNCWGNNKMESKMLNWSRAWDKTCGSNIPIRGEDLTCWWVLPLYNFFGNC